MNETTYKLVCRHDGCGSIWSIKLSSNQDLMNFIKKHDWKYLPDEYQMPSNVIDIICDKHAETKGCRNILCQCRK